LFDIFIKKKDVGLKGGSFAGEHTVTILGGPEVMATPPGRPARVLLKIIDKNPDVVERALAVG
jgi:hypothetical protein